MGPNPHAQESDVDEAPGAAGTPDSTTPEVPASPGAAGKPGSPTGAGPASPTVSELLCQMQIYQYVEIGMAMKSTLRCLLFYLNIGYSGLGTGSFISLN